MTLITKPNYKYIWAVGGDVVEPSDLKKQQGWTAEVPPFQYENWIQHRQDQYLAHINQRGIPAWDGQTEYEAGGLSYVQGSDGKIYKSVAASGPATTIKDPTTDATDTYWTVAFADFGAFLTPAEGDTRYAKVANNLSDLTNVATARTNLGAAPIVSPTLTGTPSAPTAAVNTNTTQIATTAFVQSQLNSSVPAATETVAGKVELATAAETTTGTDNTRAVHPAGLKVELDKKAPIASPAFTGTPSSPTAAAGTNTTQLATTAFVQSQKTTSPTDTTPGRVWRTDDLVKTASTSDQTTGSIIKNGDKQVCTAWVNFNGTGTVAIRDSYNVSSITDLWTGYYTVNFTTAMNNTNYAVSNTAGTSAAGNVTNYGAPRGAAPTVSSVNVFTGNFAGAADVEYVSVIIFGGK